jgi:hypothetical protein
MPASPLPFFEILILEYFIGTKNERWLWRLTPIILATQEAEIMRITV